MSSFPKNGVHLLAIGRLLGHSSVKVTERYAHLDRSTVDDAVGHIGYLGQPVGNTAPETEKAAPSSQDEAAENRLV